MLEAMKNWLFALAIKHKKFLMVIGTLGILIHVVGWKQLLVISGSVILAIAALIFFVLFIAVWIDGVQRKKDRTGPTLVLFLIDAALWIWLGHIWSLF